MPQALALGLGGWSTIAYGCHYATDLFVAIRHGSANRQVCIIMATPVVIAHTEIPPRPSPEDAGADTRERILRTAYELFTQHGLTAVGVDRIVAEAGVAKTTLYRHFRSKDALVVAVLERHVELWLLGWLQSKVSRAGSPRERLLAIFDAFEEWFASPGFEGCLLMNSLAETHDRSAVRAAAVHALGQVYVFVHAIAQETGLRRPADLAHQLQALMCGSIIAAVEGRSDAVRSARSAAETLVGVSREMEQPDTAH